jgi:hypothetical protein
MAVLLVFLQISSMIMMNFQNKSNVLVFVIISICSTFGLLALSSVVFLKNITKVFRISSNRRVSIFQNFHFFHKFQKIFKLFFPKISFRKLSRNCLNLKYLPYISYFPKKKSHKIPPKKKLQTPPHTLRKISNFQIRKSSNSVAVV